MEIGDKVRFLREVGGGRVAGFRGKDIVIVEDENGFQIPTLIKEVVVIGDDDYSSSRIVERKAAQKRALEEPSIPKENKTINSQKSSSCDSSDQGLVVVDLHAEALLGNAPHMSPIEILGHQIDAVRMVLRQNSKNKGRKIILIHGKGAGVLRKAVIDELKAHFASYPYQDASFREYGFGATQVTIV